jgi:hypothetical protein
MFYTCLLYSSQFKYFILTVNNYALVLFSNKCGIIT